MASDKMLKIQSDITDGLERQSEDKYKQEQLQKLDAIKQTQLATMQAMADMIKGHTAKTEVINQLKSISTPDIDKVVKSVDKMYDMINSKTADYSPLLPSLEKIIAQLELVPKEHAEIPEAESIDLSETNTLLRGLETAVGALKLEVKVDAPIVKVPQTKLTVEKTDLSEIKQPLLDIISAVTNIPVPVIEYTDTTLIEEKLDKSNVLLEKIVKKPSGGGSGGGGNGTPYVDVDGKPLHVELINGKIPVDIDMVTEGIATETTLAKLNGFSLPVFDAIVPTFNATSDVWVYKTGGAAGTTVATLTVSYTDSTKSVITSVVRS